MKHFFIGLFIASVTSGLSFAQGDYSISKIIQENYGVYLYIEGEAARTLYNGLDVNIGEKTIRGVTTKRPRSGGLTCEHREGTLDYSCKISIGRSGLQTSW
jgi:hypothetical protein